MKVVLGVLLLLLMLGTIGCLSSQPKDNALFLANLGHKEDGDEFANAFAQEPECSGLSLSVWTDHIGDDPFKGLEEAGWLVVYAYHGVSVERRHPHDGPFGPSIHMDGAAKTPLDAAKWVCSVAKKKGGQLRGSSWQ